MENWTNNSYLTKSLLSHDAYFTILLYRIFGYSCFYFIGVFFPFGIVFNALLLVVFSLTPQGTTHTTRVYYLVMAYGELATVIFKDLWVFFLGTGLPSVFEVNPLGPFNPALAVWGDWLCPLMLFLWYSHEILANTTFVLFEFERVVALYVPLHARRLFTYSFAVYSMAAVGLYSCAVGALIFGFGRSSPVSTLPLGHLCIFSSSISVWSKIAIIEFFANYVFPASLSILCSVLISAKILRRSSNKRRLNSRAQSSITSAPRISNRELQILFYVPLSAFRLAYLVLPAVGPLAPETENALLGAGFLCYTVVLPVHTVNFVVCCARVRGFASNVRRVLVGRYPDTRRQTTAGPAGGTGSAYRRTIGPVVIVADCDSMSN